MREVVIGRRRASVGERREKRSQVIGSRLFEGALMEPPHESLSVDDDQVGIVLVLRRIGEASLPLAGAAIDRDDLVVEIDRRAAAHSRSMNHRPSVASPPIIGTSKNVTSVLEPIVARYQLPHASTGKRDL